MTVGIIGTGAWPLTIAKCISENGHRVAVWAYRDEIAQEINETGSYQKSLGDTFLSDPYTSSTDVQEVVSQSEALVIGLASSYINHVEAIAPFVGSKPIIILTKGLMKSGQELFVSDYIRSFCPKAPIAVLSGPNLAGEILKGLPSATVVASKDRDIARYFQSLINHTCLRVYTSQDVRGVELGGILKNIIAIAAGCSDGLGFGSNSKSALVTRGLQEMIRFSSTYKCQRETFFGLSGIGDLIATCHSTESRNYQFGYQLGKGVTPKDALEKVNRVVEGVNTLEVIHRLTRTIDIDMPILNEVYDVVFKEKSPKDSISTLMERGLKSE